MHILHRPWHLHHGDDDEHDEDNDADAHVRVADDGKVVEAYGGLLTFRKRVEDNLSGSVAAVAPQVGEHDERCHSHTAERAHGVEGLCQVQTPRRSFLRTEREDKGIGRGLEEGEAEGEDIERTAEECETLLCRGGDEEEGSDGIERKPEENAVLVVVAADEECRRDGHGGITAVEGKLHHGGLAGRKFHNGLEGGHHGIGNIVGKAPKRKEGGDEHEGNDVGNTVVVEDGFPGLCGGRGIVHGWVLQKNT